MSCMPEPLTSVTSARKLTPKVMTGKGVLVDRFKVRRKPLRVRGLAVLQTCQLAALLTDPQSLAHQESEKLEV